MNFVTSDISNIVAMYGAPVFVWYIGARLDNAL